MGNEMFQARLPDDFAERIHEYREENHMSKSEAVRHLLRRGLEAEQEDTDADAEREGRLQALARLGEKVAATGTVLAFVSLFLPAAAGLAGTPFTLTLGILGLVAVLATTATVLIVVSYLGLFALLVLYGIEVGFFGRTLAKIAPATHTEATA